MYKSEIRKHGERERDFHHLESLISDMERRARMVEVSMNEIKKGHEETIQG